MSGLTGVATRQTELTLDRPRMALELAAAIQFGKGTALLDQRQFADAEFCLREAHLFRPDHSETLNNLGTAIWQQRRPSEAEVFYWKAYKLDPLNFAVLNNLGNVLWERRQLDEAAEAYERALELRPDSSDTLINLGVVRTHQELYDEATACLLDALEIQPDSHQAFDNLGSIQSRKGLWEEAISYYDQALALKPDYPESHRNRSFALLALGDFERGWPEYEWRLKCQRYSGFNCINRPRWDGGELAGKRILLHCEQGLGDNLQFIRYARLLKEKGARTILVYCHQPLARLFARSPSVDDVIVTDSDRAMPDFDVHASLLSLPALLRTTLENLPREVPYLSADADTIAAWRPIVARALGEEPERSATSFRIGIAWQGNPLNGVDQMRSFPLERMAPLAAVPGVKLISIQKGFGTDQIQQLASQFPVAELKRENGDGDDDRDFLDTAAVMSLLDLTITPETSVAHLAGSLGVPVWVALSSGGDWRWQLDKDGSPWYPSMRLFRQTRSQNWHSVFERMADELRQRLAG